MGKADRERRERIRRGEEVPIAELRRREQQEEARQDEARQRLGNPIFRAATRLGVRSQVAKTLQEASTAEQIEVLSSIRGKGVSKVGKAIQKNAPKEMDKGIRELLKKGETVTVEKLLREVKTTPGFLEMCERAGVSLEWFENLARERMEALGVTEVR